jgi:hypothetical protein
VALLVACADGTRSKVAAVGRSDSCAVRVAVLGTALERLALDTVDGVCRSPEDTDGISRLAIAGLHLTGLGVL